MCEFRADTLIGCRGLSKGIPRLCTRGESNLCITWVVMDSEF